MLEVLDAKEVSEVEACSTRYSFCSLVTNLGDYHKMISAFRAKGFTAADCEFIYIDNSGANTFDAYAGNNHFLQVARGHYIVLCHQDILPIEDGRERLDALLDELTRLDPDWGLCGNAGVAESGQYAIRITDPTAGELHMGAPHPARVMSLDENFIVVRRAANLALSHDLSGFHWYGSDLCIIADVCGWHAYVIGFHLRHLSSGNADAAFEASGRRLSEKYALAFRPRWQNVVTMKPVYLSASNVDRRLVLSYRTARRALGKVRRTLRAVRTSITRR